MSLKGVQNSYIAVHFLDFRKSSSIFLDLKIILDNPPGMDYTSVAEILQKPNLLY